MRRIDAEQGRLDVHVNDIWGGELPALAADPDVHRRNGASLSSGLAREYGVTDVDGSQCDAWRYLVEVQEAGLPSDPTGYR